MRKNKPFKRKVNKRNRVSFFTKRKRETKAEKVLK